MKKVFLLSIVLNAGNYIFAQQQVSNMEVRNAAIHTFYSKSEVLKISDNARVKTIHNFRNGRGDTLMYEVVFQNNVGVLLSGSKTCLPVLAYYTKPEHDNGSIFDANNENVPCCFKELLREYAQEIDSCFAKNTRALHYVTQWQEIQDTIPNRINRYGAVIVEPLLKTEWSQYKSEDGRCDAYNYYITDEHEKCTTCISKLCPVGCVAVAMAQIMNYWKYPVYVLGKVQQYDWCNMPNILYYNYNPKYETERNAIARLMKDCGDAANTNYCSGGCSSSSTVYKARQAFVNDLGYSSDADHQWKSSYNINTWIGRIKNNLNNGWPVLYGGYDPSPPAGHSFVLDGYTNDDYFHVNWGWGTGWNAYCTLDDLTLDASTFSTQSACFYIYPDDYPNHQDYCNFTFPLTLHFDLGGIQENVPKTFTVLESVPSGNGFPTSYHTIVSGHAVEYVAHKRIVLQTGFKVEAGAHFIARIEPCESCETSQSMLFLSQNEDSTFNYHANDASLQKSFENLQEEERASNKFIDLFPNPNNGTFTIKTNFDEEEILSIQVYNILGQRIYKQTGLSDNTIQLPQSAKGIFWVEIMTQSQSFIKKITVK
ncbi:MAG: C10 family peptidase [Bacteroidales bacterium]